MSLLTTIKKIGNSVVRELFWQPGYFAITQAQYIREYRKNEKYNEVLRRGIELGRRIERWELDHNGADSETTSNN